MHIEILTEAQIAILERLKLSPHVPAFYLAGRTALALRHRHRRSIDFDFFRADAFDGYALIAQLRHPHGARSSRSTSRSKTNRSVEARRQGGARWRRFRDRRDDHGAHGWPGCLCGVRLRRIRCHAGDRRGNDTQHRLDPIPLEYAPLQSINEVYAKLKRGEVNGRAVITP